MQQAISDIAVKYQGVAPQRIINAVADAATRTGADFAYLMNKAEAESSFDAGATATTSSAKGLFQFIDSTWLGMVKEYGEKYGLGNEAAQIEIKDGKSCVGNCDVKEKILALRQDPRLSALMAGEYSAQNKNYLEKNTSGDVGATELYFAHFMGANGATKFLNTKAQNSDAIAAKFFPEAARANKNVFFDRKTGAPLSFQKIYDNFANKFNKQDSGVVSISQDVTSNPKATSVTPVASMASPHDMLQQVLLSLDNGADDYSLNDNLYSMSQIASGRGLSAHTLMTIAEIASDTTGSMPRSGFGARQADRQSTYGYNL